MRTLSGEKVNAVSNVFQVTGGNKSDSSPHETGAGRKYVAKEDKLND